MLPRLTYVSAARPNSHSAHAVYVNRLLSVLAQQGIQCHLIAPGPWRRSHSAWKGNFPLTQVRCYPPVRLRYFIMALGLLFSRNSKDEQNRLFVTHNGLFAVVLLLRGKRLLYDMHHAIVTRLGCRVTRWIARHPRCVALSVISEGMRQHLAERGISHKRVVLRRNGADIPPEATELTNRRSDAVGVPFVVAYCGHLEAARGVEILLKVAPLIPADIVFRIVGGTATEVERLQLEVQRRNLTAHFEFFGKVPHHLVNQYLLPADVLLALYTRAVRNIDVMCPMKLIEYLALGRPIVAADFSTVRELIDDGRNGLLYKPEDAEHLAAILCRLRSDPDLRAMLGAQARASAKRLTWERNGMTLIQGAFPSYVHP